MKQWGGIIVGVLCLLTGAFNLPTVVLKVIICLCLMTAGAVLIVLGVLTPEREGP